MKIYEAKKKANLKLIIGILGFIIFSFNSLLTILKTFYDFSSLNFVKNIASNLISLIYSYTSSLSFYWNNIFPFLPILDQRNIIQVNTFYFFGLIIFTVLFLMQILDSFIIRRNIKKAIIIAELKELNRDAEISNGNIFQTNAHTTIEIDISQQSKWYKQPTGLIIIGLSITIMGKNLSKCLGL